MKTYLKAVLAGGALIGAVVGGGAIAMAATPSADNTITACFSQANPNLRVIDAEAGQACATGETKLSWGGGMRFLTTWGKWDNVKRENGYPVIRKGDVVRYDGDPKAFGCTTPKGSWVSVAGAYSYPCVEHPQNWVPLALDGAAGAPGKNADAHWATLNADMSLKAASDNGVQTYAGTGYSYIYFPFNVTNCAATATLADYTSKATIVSAAPYYDNYVLVVAKDASQNFVNAPVNVALNCASYK